MLYSLLGCVGMQIWEISSLLTWHRPPEEYRSRVKQGHLGQTPNAHRSWRRRQQGTSLSMLMRMSGDGA